MYNDIFANIVIAEGFTLLHRHVSLHHVVQTFFWPPGEERVSVDFVIYVQAFGLPTDRPSMAYVDITTEDDDGVHSIHTAKGPFVPTVAPRGGMAIVGIDGLTFERTGRYTVNVVAGDLERGHELIGQEPLFIINPEDL